MLRHPALTGLSEEHHDALVLARRCRRLASTDQAEEVWAEVVRRFREELEPHFQCEERWLLPPLESHEDARLLVQRTHEDHAELRRLIAEESNLEERLDRFGELLTSHVRFEERELFELAQARLSEEQLRLVAACCPKKTVRRRG